MTYIDECRAPEIPDTTPSLLMQYSWNRAFLGCGTADRKANSFVANYVVAVDKAIREYEAGRNQLIEYAASENEMFLLVEALGRFETCINSTKRALRFADQLARHPEGPRVERLARRLLQSKDPSITSLRDSIEHMDERIQRDRVLDGAPHMLAISRDSRLLLIENYELSFKTLATLLEKLWELAIGLVQYKEPRSPDV